MDPASFHVLTTFLTGQDVGNNLAIVGDEFMKGWVSVFDLDKKAVGFAKANH